MWIMTVELEFSERLEDRKVQHQGDTEVDFAKRSVERQIRPWLNEAQRTGIIQYYTLMPQQNGMLARSDKQIHWHTD